MAFYFNGHIKDRKKYEHTQQIELNSYPGRMRFDKKDGKFL
jgi:hypothetical protein